jgi:hypothetical protein
MSKLRVELWIGALSVLAGATGYLLRSGTLEFLAVLLAVASATLVLARFLSETERRR